MYFTSALQDINIVNLHGYFFQTGQAGKGYREHSWILIPSELKAMNIVSTRGYRNSADKKRTGLTAAQPAKWNGGGRLARPAHLGCSAKGQP